MLLTFLRNFRKMELDKILLDVSDGLDMRKINGDLYAVLKFKFLFMGATFLQKYHKNPLEGGTITFFFGLHSLAKAKELKKVEKEHTDVYVSVTTLQVDRFRL